VIEERKHILHERAFGGEHVVMKKLGQAIHRAWEEA
jgi:hypothetical protein